MGRKDQIAPPSLATLNLAGLSGFVRNSGIIALHRQSAELSVAGYLYLSEVFGVGKKLTELQFTEELIKALKPFFADAKIDSGNSVLYEMPIDDDGVVRMGVDTDTGE